jgi:hypothetical protein
MERYLFRFGYCTPPQWTANEANDWDDESSGAFLVAAKDKEEALAWGQEVAERYVRLQFESAGWVAPPSWKEAAFANWIEQSPEKAFSAAELALLPLVSAGQMPTFENWPS